MRPPSLAARVVLIACSTLAAACVGPRTTDLDDLLLRDSTYLDPGTLEPFSGHVVRRFSSDPGKVQLDGTLEDGTWEGELTFYHESGRIRYQGRLSRGTPCGAWVENRDDEPSGSLYRELRRDIESMGLYPDCPDD